MEFQSMPCPRQSSDALYGGLSLLYILIAVVLLILRYKYPNTKKTQFVLLTLVLIGPPLWFLFQFNHIYLPIVPKELLDKPICETFKYNQDLAAKMWAGVSALVLAVAYKKKDAEVGG